MLEDDTYQKSPSYHRAAIRYNEKLADFAKELAESLEHEEIKRWCRSVAKQHRFHAGRHKRALSNLIKNNPELKSKEPDMKQSKKLTESEEQAAFAAEMGDGNGENPNQESPQPDRKTGENPDAEPVEAGVGTPVDDRSEEDSEDA